MSKFFFFLRRISFNMVDVDNQKVDWRQLLEEEDSMPSSSQWVKKKVKKNKKQTYDGEIKKTLERPQLQHRYDIVQW